MQPEVILFDEVTSALDPELTEEVLKVMEDLARRGMTMMLVTHEMSFARQVADVLVFMNNGKIWEIGPSKELRSEEHTSELQFTNAHLVCRLLLEKKNKTSNKKSVYVNNTHT